MVDLNVDGAKSSPNSVAELQNALKSAGGKNKNVTINLNQDIVGDPIELPDKTTVTFNLNGHTINRNLTSQNSSGHTLLVGKNSRVTINGGEGKVQKQVMWLAVAEEIDIATPFFFSDGYFFDDPESCNNHLATTSMCMAMSDQSNDEVTSFMKPSTRNGQNEDSVWKSKVTASARTQGVAHTLHLHLLCHLCI